jgi:hypothetical protein
MRNLAFSTLVSLSFLVTTIGLFLPIESNACTCAVRPLVQRYEQASVVFVASVGIRSDQFDEAGNRSAEWPFEIDEMLKGDVTFDALISGGCGWGAASGEKYLLFADRNGSVGSCTAGRLSQNDRYRADLDVLRSYRDGDLQTLSEPWVFSKSVGRCTLSLDMTVGHGSLIFEYRFADADAPDFRDEQFQYDIDKRRTVKLEGVGPHPAYFAGFRRLRIWYPYAHYKVEGTGRLMIGDKEWPAEYQNMEAPISPFEVVTDSAFGEIFTAVKSHISVGLAAEYTDFPYNLKDYPDFPVINAATPQLYRGAAVENFQECMDRAGQ